MLLLKSSWLLNIPTFAYPVYCARACPKPLGWSEEEGELVWDRTSAEGFWQCSGGTVEVVRSTPWVIVDVRYPKHIHQISVRDSNIWVPVTLIKHTPIHDSCDLDGYGCISSEPSCRNKWHFEKSLSSISRCKVDTRVVEGGKWWNESCMGLCIVQSDENLFTDYRLLWGENTDYEFWVTEL